jgi:hydroxyacylglutathione hydrolase
MNIVSYPIKVSKLSFKNYCYLIINTYNKKAILIDPAWEMEKNERQLEHHQVTLVSILLTHHHFDHVNLANSLALKYHVPVMMSKTEIEYYGFSCHNLSPIGQTNNITIEQIEILPLFTPGHTRGAISYWVADNLFSGDTLFIEGCGICIGHGGDPSQMFDSLSYLKAIIPIDTKIYPGHSYGKEPGLPFPYLLRNNIYLQFNNKQQFIDFRMRKNQKGIFDFK